MTRFTSVVFADGCGFLYWRMTKSFISPEGDMLSRREKEGASHRGFFSMWVQLELPFMPEERVGNLDADRKGRN
jgi:hypothetical protein